MKNYFCFTVFALILLTFQVSGQGSAGRELEGSWMGKLNAGGIFLRVIFNLTAAGNDSLTATLDSPDQGAKGIKIGPVSLHENEIRIAAPLLLAEYNGTIKNDTLIEGIFKQAGTSLPLTLTKLREQFTLKRPQEPLPPYPYTVKDVTFTNHAAGIDLAGTLTLPEGEGPHPAVILITGSGTQNRDEEILGHKPFLVIADHLTRNGIAVLRFDDRGAGRSKGTPLNATSADFASDAAAAFRYLKSEGRIDTAFIGLAGHSEGGFIAPIVASENPEIAFIISLAGTGVPGEEILHRQNLDISLAYGAGRKETEEAIRINEKLFRILVSETDNIEAERKIVEEYRSILEEKGTSPEETEKGINQLKAGLNPASYNWMRYFIKTNPADYWKRVKCPVLAINGEKDLQVNAGINTSAIEKALRSGGNKKVTVRILPGLNHLFQHSSTGLPAEYGEIEETISPEVLQLMSEWILNVQMKRQAF